MKILIVCTGNTCRSPMAEGIFRSLGQERGLDILVKSVGIAVFDGENASTNAIKAMENINIDISTHKSSQFHKGLVEEYDLILTMANSHKETIVLNFPDSKDKVFTLLEYAYKVEKDVEDPFGKNLILYENTRDEIYEAILNIINKTLNSFEDN